MNTPYKTSEAMRTKKELEELRQDTYKIIEILNKKYGKVKVI